MINAGREYQLRAVARSLPQAYGELGPELIAAEQFARGVRRLNLDEGGPTSQLRHLVDDLRHGMATVDELDTALDDLEDRLCIARTSTFPALADGGPETEGTAYVRVH